MATILNLLIPRDFHVPEDGNYPELEYYECQIRHPDDPSKLILNHEIKNNEDKEVPKGRIYFKVKGKEGWREGMEPYHIRGLFPLMALANAIIFAGTLMFRTIQTIIILTGVFFRAHRATCKETQSPEFTDRFFQALEKEIGDQKIYLNGILTNLKRDVTCFTAMELAAVLGTFTSDPRKMVHMQTVWGEMEFQWNRNDPYDKTFLASVCRTWKTERMKVDSEDELLVAVEEGRGPVGEEVKESTFSGQLEQQLNYYSALMNKSNKAFYLFECAQVRGEGISSRIVSLEPSYTSYEAVLEAIRQKAPNVS